MDNFQSLKSQIIKKIEYSAISEILRVINKEGMISLAGGLPAPESFPLDIIKKLSYQTIEKYQEKAFQYSSTEGEKDLREPLVEYLKEKGIKTTWENIGITNGSQQALDLIGRIFINKNDYLAVESPTYIGAIDAFAPYQPKYIQILTDNEGIIPESLEKILKTKKVKFVYLIPTFQNPTGKTIPKTRRQQIVQILKKYQTLLIEDDPYSALRYQGKDIAPIQSFLPNQTVYLSTFSKILAPGLRIGFYVAPKEIVKLICTAKQTADLHTNSFSQYIAALYLKTGHLKKHLPKILSIYKKRQQIMLNALDKYFPKNFSWTQPDGGMFIWVEGPKNFNSITTYWQAIKENVAYVPGQYFFVKKNFGKNTFRLNFTNVSEEKIELAIKKLSQVIKKNL